MGELLKLTREAIEAYHPLPQPVLVFAAKSLRMLEANSAALSWLAYDAPTFRGLSLDDLRPKADRDEILEALRGVEGTPSAAGEWELQAEGGPRYVAPFTCSKVILEGTAAIVASVRDISAIRPVQDEKGTDCKDAAPVMQSALSVEDLSRLVDAFPEKVLVLSPGDHKVIAVTNEYAQTVACDRGTLLGQSIPTLFPEEPSELEAREADRLRASLRRVETLGVTDVINLQVYPIRQAGRGFQDRIWISKNKPVFDAAGNVLFIVHSAEDVTDVVGEASAKLQQAAAVEAEHLVRLSELSGALLALQERDKRLKTAEALLNLGSWEYDLDREVLNWSARAFDIYGHSRPPRNFEEYLALMPAQDREKNASQFADFIASGASEIEFHHRVVRANGSIAYIRGAGVRHLIDGREILIGVVQDITAIKQNEKELQRQARRWQLAGRLARLGSWRVDLTTEQTIWFEEVAAIHDEPEGMSPSSPEEAMGYYLPQYRERIRARFEACAQDGKSFEEILQIETAKGRRVWVRAVGEAVRSKSGQIIAVEGALQDVTELVQMREIAKETSHQLEQTLQGMSDAFFLLDYQWRFAFINVQAEKLMRRRKEELLGQNVWQEFPEAVGSQFQEQYEHAVDTGEPVWFQEYYPPLDIWMEVRAEPTSAGLAVYYRDITEQRIRDEQLRLLEAAVSRQNDILLITEAEPVAGPDGPKIVYVNEAFERLTGYSREEVIGKTPRILQGPKTQAHELTRIRRALERWQPVRSEVINYTKSGNEFWLEMDIVPLADEAGWFTHWVAIERDISERKSSELALKLNEERFSLVSKASGSAVWDWDAATGEQWWSEGLRYIFGHEPDRAGENSSMWNAHVHPEDMARVTAAFARVRAGESNSMREQYRFERADGTWVFVEDKAFALRDSDGHVVRILGSMTDITETKQLEERLLQSQKMETVGQLTGGIAHDFNNLLMVILGNSEALEDELSDQPRLQRLAQTSLKAAEKGAELTKRLLAFSRKQALEPTAVDVAQLLQGMDEILRRTLPENITLELSAPEELWKAEIDATQLETALLNLSVNARDAMPKGGFLTIEAANAALNDVEDAAHIDVVPGEYVVLNVADTGQGIAPENLSRVFEPFYTTKEVGKGSGLGLSMVFGFVKQSGGHIRIYSEPEEGTAIQMYFPRARSGETSQTINQGAAPKATGGAETILVVEDDDAVREHVIAQLESLGYYVLEASAGAKAVEILKQSHKIDMLFTDVVMPGGMSGKELADIARQLRPNLKVLYTSGYTENSIVHHGKLDDGVSLLRKPYRREQLAAKVREVLGVTRPEN